MSVPVSKRSQSTCLAVCKADELCAYTVKICSNEKNFPKRYRWCLTNKIVDSAANVDRFASAANSIRVTDTVSHQIRRGYQLRSFAESKSLESMVRIAYNTFHIDDSRIEYWAQLIYDVQNLLYAWIKSEETENDKVSVVNEVGSLPELY